MISAFWRDVAGLGGPACGNMTNAEYEAHLKRIDHVLAGKRGRSPVSNACLTTLMIAWPLADASILAA